MRQLNRLMMAVALFTWGAVAGRSPAQGPGPTPRFADHADTGVATASYVGPEAHAWPEQAHPAAPISADPAPGWFVTAELGLVVPHIRNNVTAKVSVLGIADTIPLPVADLDFTASPRIGLGYRFPLYGEIELTWRTLVSNGDGLVTNFDALGDGFLHSRINMNVIDMDFTALEQSLWPNWGMRWRAGVRTAIVFYDTRIDGLLVSQKSSEHFAGAGPHAGLELWRRLPWTGLSLYGKADGAMLVGSDHQASEETVFLGNGVAVGDAVSVRSTSVPVMINLQAGLRYAPPNLPGFTLMFAYEWEQWFGFGPPGGPHSEVGVQGVSVRGEFNF